MPVIYVLAGFVLSALSVALLLPALRRMQFRQHAYEDAPQSHKCRPHA